MPIIPQEIETEISLLPYNKALGLYSTPVKLLKLAKSVKSIPLKGGGRPTRLLPHAKMLLIPIRLFLSAG